MTFCLFSFQFNKPGCCAEGDTPSGGRGRSIHCHQRGVSPEAAEARKHRHPSRHHSHQRDPHICLRVCGETFAAGFYDYYYYVLRILIKNEQLKRNLENVYKIALASHETSAQ